MSDADILQQIPGAKIVTPKGVAQTGAPSDLPPGAKVVAQRPWQQPVAGPSAGQEFVTGMAPDPRSELATAKQAVPGAYRDPLSGDINYKDQQGRPQDYYSGVGGLGELTRGAAGALTALAAAKGKGNNPAIRGVLGASGAEVASDVAFKALGGIDTRTEEEKLSDRGMGLLYNSAAEGLGLGVQKLAQPAERFFKWGLGKVITGGQVLKADAKAVFDGMKAEGEAITRGALFEEPTPKYQKAIDKATENFQSRLPQGTIEPGSNAEAALGDAIIKETGSRGSKAGQYFQNRDALYQMAQSGVEKALGKSDLPATNLTAFYKDQLKAWLDLPKTGKLVQLSGAWDKYAELIKNGGTMTFRQMKELRSWAGAAMQDDAVRGNMTQGVVAKMYSALSKDMEAGAASKGDTVLKAWQAGNQIYADTMKTAEAVGKLANASTGNEAAESTGKMLTAPEMQTLKTVLHPATFKAATQHIINRLGWEGATDTSRGGFSLAKGLKEYNSIPKDTLDIMLPQGTPERTVWDTASQRAAETGFWGRDAAVKADTGIANKLLTGAKGAAFKTATAAGGDWEKLLGYLADTQPQNAKLIGRLSAFISRLGESPLKAGLQDALRPAYQQQASERQKGPGVRTSSSTPDFTGH